MMPSCPTAKSRWGSNEKNSPFACPMARTLSGRTASAPFSKANALAAAKNRWVSRATPPVSAVRTWSVTYWYGSET